MQVPPDTQRRPGLRFLLLPALLALGAAASAQHDTVRLAFQRITIQDGLSQGMVSGITQDKVGFMWFATKDGLNRYDGYDFKVFRHNPLDSTTLRDNFVVNLLCDRAGRLWVGTNSGLDLFDPATETFRHIACPNPHEKPGHATMGCSIISMAEDLNGRIWVNTFDFLGWIAPELPGIPGSPLPVIQTRLSFGVGGMSVNKQGVLQAWANKTLTHIRIDTRNSKLPVDTVPSGQQADPSAQGAIPLPSNIVSQIFFSGSHLTDRTGKTWSVIGAMLFRYDPVNKHLSHVLTIDPSQKRFLDNTSHIYMDRQGMLWVGTRGLGILIYDPRQERFHPEPGGSVRWMAPCVDGRVLVLSDSSLLFDPRSGRKALAPLVLDPSGNVSALLPDWPSIVQDNSGTFWSNINGLTRITGLAGTDLHPKQAHFEQLRPNRPFPLQLIGDSLLCFYSQNKFFFRHLTTQKVTAYPLPGQRVGNFYLLTQAISRGPAGEFWLGTMAGLMRLDPRQGGQARTGDWTHYLNEAIDRHALPEVAVFSLLQDPADPLNYVWVGTNGSGLFRLDKQSGKTIHYGLKEGLPNEVIYGLLADDDGCLWMSTNRGIAQLDPENGQVRSFGPGDGLIGEEFNRYAYCKLPDGTLFFGGVDGFNHFHPREITDDLRPVPMAITGIRLLNKPLEFGQAGSPLRMPAHMAREIAVPYKAAGMLTIDFASLEFGGSNNRQYRYQLDGFDPEVIEAGHAHSAIYTNLGPGDYTFNVWGRNRDGVWNQAPRQLLVRILPPWYMTGWARSLFALLLIGAGLLFLRVRTRSLRRQRNRLERTVQQRTAEMRKAKERAEHSERVKQQFLANMSHEIRTPMHAIVGLNNTLRRREHLPAQQPFLDAIAQSSSNLLGLVNQILDLSKIEAGRLESEKLPLEPRAVLATVAGVMRHRAEEKGLSLATTVSGQVPKVLIGDPVRLNQVLMNLVGNAIKFTGQGGIRVAMDVKTLPNGAVMLRCVVTDTGIGIAPDRLPRIFDEFTQADNSHTRKYGGSGLGLTISKRLVEMQGGTIEVESTPGSGSAFTFAIPYQLPADAAKPDLKAAPEATGAHPLEGIRILLVEDHAMNVMVAKAELTDAIPGVRIEVAVNGKIAVDMASKETYDLILMDVQMPEMDGYEATRAIRAMEGDRARVPILGITANVMRTELERCMEAGMDGHVTKPFQRDELLTAMAQVLGRAVR